MKTINSLSTRFHEYILSFPDNEDADNLDEIFLKSDGTQSKKPDYFLCNRSIFVEKKTLTKDPQNKIDQFLDPLVKADNELRNCFVSSKSLEEVFTKYSKGKELKLKLLDKLYKGFRNDIMKHANKQLRLSVEHLKAQNAQKGLLILNEDVNNFHHEALIIEIEINLQRRQELDSIDFVLLISETERDLSTGIAPYSLIFSDNCNNISYVKLLIDNSLMIGWAAYNKRCIYK